jgi:hypothetical protein
MIYDLRFRKATGPEGNPQSKILNLNRDDATCATGMTNSFKLFRSGRIDGFEGEKPESIIVIGNSGFKSAALLKNFVEKLPARSTLEWAPGCERLGGEPLLSSAKDMDDFKRLLQKA